MVLIWNPRWRLTKVPSDWAQGSCFERGVHSQSAQGEVCAGQTFECLLHAGQTCEWLLHAGQTCEWLLRAGQTQTSPAMESLS